MLYGITSEDIEQWDYSRCSGGFCYVICQKLIDILSIICMFWSSRAGEGRDEVLRDVVKVSTGAKRNFRRK